MVKEIEKRGYPVVHMINLIPVAQSVGSNRMVETVSIPYPLGNPELTKEEEFRMRYDRVSAALRSLTVPITDQEVFK